MTVFCRVARSLMCVVAPTTISLIFAVWLNMLRVTQYIIKILMTIDVFWIEDQIYWTL
jgi:hypothetical protein